MSALNIPQVNTNTIKHSGSSSSLGHSIEHENDLAPVTPRSRRNSDTHLTAAAATSTRSPSPATLTRPPTTNLRHQTTSLYAGKKKNPFTIPTKSLMDKSPFFKKLLSETPEPLAEQTTFEDLEDPAMALFAAWLQGKQLAGPSDFHSTGHYIALYVLASRFGVEELGNKVIDQTRTYYSSANMTAPPYRLEYIYTYTSTANPMRKFLVYTAAFRCLHHDGRSTHQNEGSTHQGEGISTALQEALGKNPELSLDFCNALIVLGREGAGDPRHGGKCVWHEHVVTRKCEAEGTEPWAAE